MFIPIKSECTVCGKKYIRKSHNGKYCSPRCLRKITYLNHIEDRRNRGIKRYYLHHEEALKYMSEYGKRNRELKNWYRNLRSFGGIKKDILTRDGNKCCGCGSIKRIGIHHMDSTGIKDANKETTKYVNNSIDNLITLCNSCHRRLHEWQIRFDRNLLEREDVIFLLSKMNERYPYKDRIFTKKKKIKEFREYNPFDIDGEVELHAFI